MLLLPCSGVCMGLASHCCVCRVDEQIAKLEGQLVTFREQIKKARPGPAQDAIKRRALGVSGLEGGGRVCITATAGQQHT